MKYTKYSYKKKKNNNKSIAPIVTMSVLAIALGIGVAWIVSDYVIPLTKNNISTKVEGTANTDIETVGDSEVDYVFVQCGLFGNKDYADASYGKINNDYLSFVVEDDGKYRVSAGIYAKETGDSKIEELKEKGLEASKMSFDIPSDNSVDKQVLAILDGYFKIINTLESTDVKYVNTEKFKSYVVSLEAIDSGDRVEILNSLKEHINGLANEITKNEVKSEMTFLYSVLVNYKK